MQEDLYESVGASSRRDIQSERILKLSWSLMSRFSGLLNSFSFVVLESESLIPRAVLDLAICSSTILRLIFFKGNDISLSASYAVFKSFDILLSLFLSDKRNFKSSGASLLSFFLIYKSMLSFMY